ncbi:MAG TPA: hypothetical protein PK398_03310 [Candidatus Gracilibacteria bacterium]|nr:hypothetical protein [Candidatus Gracilibacteria bacterium]
MENHYLIDLSVKYGLDDKQLSKVVDMCYQLGFDDLSDAGFHRCASYMCSMNLLSLPPEELIEEMKRKGYFKE